MTETPAFFGIKLLERIYSQYLPFLVNMVNLGDFVCFVKISQGEEGDGKFPINEAKGSIVLVLTI